MEGLKNNCVRKQMDKWMDGKSIRDVEYKYVNKALRLCLGVLGKSVNYRLQGRYSQGGITLSDSLSQFFPGYRFLIDAREGNGLAFFLTVYDFLYNPLKFF